MSDSFALNQRTDSSLLRGSLSASLNLAEHGVNLHLSEVVLTHGQEDGIYSDDPQGRSAGDPSRGLRRGNRGHDEVAFNETRAPGIPEAEGVILDPDAGQEGLLEQVFDFRTEHRGPLPDATTLQRYEEIVPGSAKGIIDGFLDEQRAQVESVREQNAALERLTKSESRAVSIGSIGSATLAIVGLVAGVMLVVLGDSIAGIIVGGVPAIVASLARVVSASKGGQSEDR